MSPFLYVALPSSIQSIETVRLILPSAKSVDTSAHFIPMRRHQRASELCCCWSEPLTDDKKFGTKLCTNGQERWKKRRFSLLILECMTSTAAQLHTTTSTLCSDHLWRDCTALNGYDGVMPQLLHRI